MELTSKERATLRGLANTMQPIFQIGKGGITPELIEQLSLALNARELIKITVLETCGLSAEETAQALKQPLRAEIVQCIGRKIVLFRMNPKDSKIAEFL